MRSNISIHVVIIVPGILLRSGLRAQVEELEGIKVVADAPSIAQVGLHDQVDVVILGEGAEGQDAVIGYFAEQGYDPGVLVISDRSEDYKRLSAITPAGWGVLPVDCLQDELALGIRVVHAGLVIGETGGLRQALSDSVAGAVREIEPVEPLTEREHEVLQLLARGMANKQIALALGISEHTVKFHVSSIYSKFGVTNRTEAVRFGLQSGLVTV